MNTYLPTLFLLFCYKINFFCKIPFFFYLSCTSYPIGIVTCLKNCPHLKTSLYIVDTFSLYSEPSLWLVLIPFLSSHINWTSPSKPPPPPPYRHQWQKPRRSSWYGVCSLCPIYLPPFYAPGPRWRDNDVAFFVFSVFLFFFKMRMRFDLLC